jgi:phosphoglycolate phosphatase-like HAD superfamily hydrolase
MAYRLIVFDFDGVIIDSGSKIAELLNDMAPDFGLKRVPEGELVKLRNFGSRELLRKLKIPTYKLPAIISRLRKELSLEIPNLKPVNGMPQVLKEMKNGKTRMGIISSNSKDNVLDFINKNEINFFDFIEGGNSYLGKDRKIRKIIKVENVSKERTVYVGDETRDIEAGRKVGVKVAAVDWGISNRSALEKYFPDHLFSTPKELLELIA